MDIKSIKLNQNKLFSLFNDEIPSIIYLKGGSILYNYDTDYEYPFRQDANFLYLTGIDSPDYDVLIDISSQKIHLFCPQRDTSYHVWHGKVLPMDYYKEHFPIDYVHHHEKLKDIFYQLEPQLIFCYDKEQADHLHDIVNANTMVDTTTLKQALCHCRVFKSKEEQYDLKKAAQINDEVHNEVRQSIQCGMKEYQLKAIFRHHAMRYGVMQEPYGAICGSGTNSAILHYLGHHRTIQKGDLVLVDAGVEYNRYISDITRTYPATGVFSRQQHAIYNIVLDAQKWAINKVKPTASMKELQLGVSYIITQGLKDEKILMGSMDDLMQNNIYTLFYPHGLGHFLGLDTHDVGGYPDNVEKSNHPGLKYLRIGRDIQTNMVLTIEPGIYFIPAVLKLAFEDPIQQSFLNISKLKEWLDFGGIRIEDNLIVTEKGNENMTQCIKEIEDIEKAMKTIK